MPGSLSWGDLATWFTGVITLGLFIIGFVQIRNERVLRTKNEAELLRRKKREQAEQISAWISGEDENGVRIEVLNASSQLVYQMVVNVVIVGQEGDLSGGPAGQACIAVAPPGEGYTVVATDYHGMHRRPGVEFAFRDTAGNNWVRKPDGQLIEIQTSTIRYYNVTLPTSWRTLNSP